MPPHSATDETHQLPDAELRKKFAVVEDEYEHHLDDAPLEINFNIRESIEILLNYDYSQLRWDRVLKYTFLHVFGIHGIWRMATLQTSWQLMAYFLIISFYGGLGQTMAAHRYFSHRSFKANSFVRVFMVGASLQAFFASIYEFVLYHRGHHKYVDTIADNINTRRGLFYSYIGNLLIKDHPKVTEGIKKLKYDDVLEDKLVMFEHKHFFTLIFFFNFLIPSMAAVYFLDESFYNSLIIIGAAKSLLVSHMEFITGSLSHIIGARPYDKNHRATDNFILTFLMLGEGWHNFHHVFPYDYKNAEFPWFKQWNPTSMVIDFFAALGWITDRKIASPALIKARKERTGEKASDENSNSTSSK